MEWPFPFRAPLSQRVLWRDAGWLTEEHEDKKRPASEPKAAPPREEPQGPADEADTRRPKRQKGDKAMAQEDPEEEPQARDKEVPAEGPEEDEEDKGDWDDEAKEEAPKKTTDRGAPSSSFAWGPCDWMRLVLLLGEFFGVPQSWQTFESSANRSRPMI